MIFDDIKLHYPSIWVQDDDPMRIVDIITTTIPKDYFMMNFDRGFSQLIDGEWKPILVENPAFEESGIKYITTHDFSVAMDYLHSQHETDPKPRAFINLVVSDPMLTAMHNSPLLNGLRNEYRSAFWANDMNKISLQMIFISTAECPEDFSRLFRIQESCYPSVAELTSILEHINTSCDRQVMKDQPTDIAKAGIGLSESEFIRISLNSILEHNEITAEFVYQAKTANIKKHGILEIIKPQITFSEIAGLDKIKDIIHRTSVLRANPEQARSYGIVPVRRLLMVGVPGTGKSAICQATAAELKLDLARTGISQVMNSFIGQSEANMRAVFKQIKALSPLCVWIDEFGRDMSGGSSSSHVDGGTTDRVHGEFLTGLQELPEETFLLCAANQLDALRPEMLRADRFDKIMFVGLPAFEERRAIFQIHLSKIDTDHSYNYDLLSQSSQRMTGAEIVSLIRETKFYVTSESFRPINTDDIMKRIPLNKNMIWLKHQDMVKSMYAYALEQWEWASTQQEAEANQILGRSAPKAAARMIMN